MKKTIIPLVSAFLLIGDLKSQDASRSVMKAYVSRLDKVSSISDYQELAYDFLRFAMPE